MRPLPCIALAGLALASCQPQGLQITDTTASRVPVETRTVDAHRDCTVHAESIWIDQQTPLRRYMSEAHTTGSTCDAAVATLVIRAREGSPVFTWTGATRDIFGLKDAKEAAAMKAALLDWIDQSGGTLKTSADLPSWEETEGQPKRAEFPFHPESSYDAAAWETLRREKLDLFCFPQGGESLSCAALREGQMESIGLQQFPG